MRSRGRLAVAVLTLSATALIGIATREHYTSTAIIPTAGDRPTFGFGSTVRDDGTPVQIGDTTTPVRALRTLQVHVGRDEPQIRACIGEDVLLHQAEFDVYVDLAYNIGAFNFCTGGQVGRISTIIQRLRAGDYVGACDAILAWRYAAGFDCSTPGNRRCGGVWTDRLRLRQQCMEAAS